MLRDVAWRCLFAIGGSGSAIIKAVQSTGNLHQRFVQRLEGAVRAFFRVAAQRLEAAKIGGKIGQHRHIGEVCAGGDIVARKGVQNGLGRLSSRFDDIFIVGRHVVLDRRHAGIEFRRHARRLVMTRLAD